MTALELSIKLSKIGYTALWLDYGVLTLDDLITQEQILDISEDKNKEHYRYSTFRQYLSTKSSLSDIAFENYLQLTLTDADPIMAASAAIDLFHKIDLTDLQFQQLCNAIGHFGVWTDKIVKRQNLLRQLKIDGLNPMLFNDCLANGDSAVLEYLIGIADKNQLETLARSAQTKRIRSLLKARLSGME